MATAEGLKLIRIDNERNFFPIEAKTGILSTSQLQVKSVLYCFDAMTQPLLNDYTRSEIERFLKLDTVSLISTWLYRFELQQKNWHELFNAKETIECFTEGESLPLIMWPEGLERELLNRLTSIRAVLQLKPEATGLDLLSSVQPQLAYYYLNAHQQLPNDDIPYQHTLSRFKKVAGALYKKDKSGNIKSSIQGPAAISQSLRLQTRMDPKLIESIHADQKLSPHVALTRFQQWRQPDLPKLYEKLIKEESKPFAKTIKDEFDQLPVRHRRLLIEDHILPRVSSLNPNVQVFILNVMNGTPWHELVLTGFQFVLTDSLLEELLKSTHNHLIKLNISHCRLLTPKAGDMISRYCTRLTYLTAQNMSWEKLKLGSTLAELKLLNIENNIQLQHLTILFKQDIELLIGGCGYNLILRSPFITGQWDQPLSLNDPDSQWKLGWMYHNGLSLRKNDTQTYYWWLRAATLSNSSAQNNLALMYLENAKLDTEEKLSRVEHLKNAAENDNSYAEFNLGLLYSKGIRFFPKDEKAAYAYFSKALEKVQLKLSVSHNGQGVIQKISSLFQTISNDGADKTEIQEMRESRLAQLAANLQMNLGLMHFNGQGTKKNYEAAFDCFSKAAEDHIMAQIYLGLLYREGWGVKKDEQEALKYFRTLAAKKDGRAIHRLGEMYERGMGVDKDIKEAIQLYEEAADLNVSEALVSLGNLYYISDTGIEKNYAKALEYYFRAAAKDNPKAKHMIGRMYYCANGVEQDYKQSFVWLESAALQNESQAQCLLGYQYLKGLGVQIDEKQAVQWYQKAVELNDSHAKVQLGWCYKDGTGVEKDFKQAIHWFQVAAEENNTAGMLGLGVIYYFGYGVQRDEKEAFNFFKKAAELNHAYSQRNLGIMYESGIGVATDDIEAASWIQKSVDKDEMNSFICLGWLYENGRGVEQDFTRAFNYYQKEIEHKDHDGEAYYRLGKMMLSGFGTTARDEKQARVYFQKAFIIFGMNVKNKSLYFCNILAKMYRNGWGVERDLSQASILFKMVIEDPFFSNIDMVSARLALGFLYLMDWNEQHAKNEELAMYWISTSLSQINFQRLILDGEQLTENEAKFLAQALQKDKHLQAISLRRNNLNDVSAGYFLDTLKENKTLTELDLMYNPVSETILYQIEQALVHNRKRLQTLIKKLKSLSELKNPKSGGLQDIKISLSKQSPIKELKIIGNAPGSEAFQKGYDLYWQGQTEKAIPFFLEAAEKNYVLAAICLSDCYQRGVYGVVADSQRAESYRRIVEKNRDWLKQKAEEGDATLQTLLGYCYSMGNRF